MLAFTPEVESLLRWFDATHEVVVDGMNGRAWYRRAALPGRGSVGDQDARVLDAMELLRHVHDDLLRPATKKAKTET